MKLEARRAGSLLVTLLLFGCGNEVTGPTPPSDAPIRTDSGSYVLRPDGAGLVTEIGIQFTNTSDERFYIVNCNGLLSPLLEKEVEGGWEPFWSPALPACLSPPLVIEPGATLGRTLTIRGALPPSDVAPTFASADVEGTYRLVLDSVVYDYDPNRSGFGEPVPLELRVSSSFELTR